MMMNDMNKNTGVHCEVESCMYNTSDCGCNAATIDVGPMDASCCKETCCGTYKQK